MTILCIILALALIVSAALNIFLGVALGLITNKAMEAEDKLEEVEQKYDSVWKAWINSTNSSLEGHAVSLKNLNKSLSDIFMKLDTVSKRTETLLEEQGNMVNLYLEPIDECTADIFEACENIIDVMENSGGSKKRVINMGEQQTYTFTVKDINLESVKDQITGYDVVHGENKDASVCD